MGGRGSAGGKSGGGSAIPRNEPSMSDFKQYFKDKFSKMTDKELNRAYINSRNLMNKENAKAEFERRKLEELNKKFKNVKMYHANYEKKSTELEKQMAKLDEASARASIRETIHFLAVNEKYNVRGKKK